MESRLFVLKILLVDDDIGSLRGMQLALGMLKHTSDVYSNPCEAIKNYSKHTYDLIITDIYMPNINGFMLEKTIRCVDPGVKIIFMSGQSIEMIDRQIDIRVERIFLRKPIDFYLLKQTLDQVSIKNQSRQSQQFLNMPTN
jgi:DNA-binding NtrC family response regulator